MIKSIVIFLILFLAEVIFLKIAAKKNIKDNPNQRSAHTIPTLRGGGIVIIISIVVYTLFYYPENTSFYYFLIGAILVAVVSFIDDLVMLSSKLRIVIHFLALTLMFLGLDLFANPSLTSILFLMVVYVFSIGFLNIYNFMDGINGITFLNALISYLALLYLNINYLEFTDTNLLVTIILSVVVFGFFNFRKNAVCFAGDIGSITIGFSLIYFILKLYIISNNPLILMILAVYLLDGGLTILERLLRKENIFEAHKRHLYQLLANDLKISHLKVATYYFVMQLLINILLVVSLLQNLNPLLVIITLAIILTIVYTFVKVTVIKKTNTLA